MKKMVLFFKKMNCLLLAFIVISIIQCTSLSSSAQVWCTTGLYQNGCSWGGIVGFHLSDINLTGHQCSGSNDLTDMTTTTGTLAEGETYYFSITTNSSYSYGDYVAIWIDLNNNGDFDEAGELLFSSSTGGQLSGFFTMPAGIDTGMFRLRLRTARWTVITNTDACSNYWQGEAQDYTAHIVAAPACPGISGVSVSNITHHTADINCECSGCSGPFIIEYGLQGFVPGTDLLPGTGGTVNIVPDLSSFPYTLTGLSASSDYEVYIRRNCNEAGFSTNLGPVGFSSVWDACSTLTAINCGEPVDYQVSPGYGEYNSTNCSSSAGKERIYEFIPQVTGNYTLSILTGVDYSHNIIYSYKPASLGCNDSSWICLDNWVGMHLIGTLSAGVPYLFLLDENNTTGTEQQFQIDCYVPYYPCSTITQINCSEPVQATIPPGVGAYSTSCDFNNTNPGKEIIYRFTPTITGMYTLTVINCDYSAEYSYKEVSSGCDQGGWFCINSVSWNNNIILLLGTLIANTSYYIMLDAGTLYGANHLFQINCADLQNPCDSMISAECETPFILNIPPGIGHYYNAPCGFNDPPVGKEKIIQYTPQTSGIAGINVSYNGYGLDGAQFLYKEASAGCGPDGWTCIGESGGDPWLQFPSALAAGTAYYILVDAVGYAGSSFTLVISCPENWDPCQTIAPISCSVPVTADIPPGYGAYNMVNENNQNNSFGKELIYSFSPDYSGSVQIDILSTDYNWIKYYIKDASSGCNDLGWYLIDNDGYPTDDYPYYSPIVFQAGHTYYLLLDADELNGAVHTFEITCPDSEYDPCASIPQVNCGDTVQVNLPQGLGVFSSPSNGSGGYDNMAGKEELFEFIPEITGVYMLNVTPSVDWDPTSYFFKEASTGCNDNGWTFITNDYWVAGTFTGQLLAGTPYYIKIDKFWTGSLSESFEIICPSEAYDPCANIVQIADTGVEVTTTHAPGLGAFGLNGCGNEETGKENIFEFAPSFSGNFSISSSGNYGGDVYYYIKPASLGCNSGGWQCFGMEQFFSAGTSYYILAAPYDISGAEQVFTINYLGIPPDPCENITTITNCGYNHMMPINIPQGYALLSHPACQQYPSFAIGREQLFSFTPNLTTDYSIQTWGLNNYVNFYIKNASSGCNGNDWICLYADYPYYDPIDFPFPLVAGNTYYIMAASGYYWGISGNCGFYITCPSGCVQYHDNDGDGYGNPNELMHICYPVYGYVHNGLDCNDNDPAIHPGAPEIIDGTDNNCNGLIDEPCTPAVLVSVTGDNVVCYNCANGSLQAMVNSGTAPYQFLWSDGSTTQAISGLAAGTYDVTITSANGCTATASFTITSLDLQIINLLSGWNIYSTYINPVVANISSVLAPVIGNVIIVKDENGQTFWPQYNVNNIGNLITGKGYQFKMSSNVQLTINGTALVPENTPLYLHSGWGLMGYLRQSPASVVQLLSGIAGNIIIMKDGGGHVYWPQYNYNSIGNLIPGLGYQLKMSNPVILEFPANSANLEKCSSLVACPRHFILNINTGNNMTLGIFRQLMGIDKPASDVEIGVYDQEGLLVGSGVLKSGFNAITLWGDDVMTPYKDGLTEGEAFSLIMWNPATGEETPLVVEKWQEGSGNYSVNGISVAAIHNPADHEQQAILYQNNPNPFNQSTEIRFFLPEKTFAEVYVCNVLGEKIEVLLSEEKPAGENSVQFSTKNYSAGIYFYKLETPGATISRVMEIIR
ncbi:MAG: GEVED domain-containing protein [Bacteroidia bacterium]|nr:GEVED domain-containing protein [Bacteroidia bacterium]